MMDITRNQYFFAGLLLLMLGGQLRMVDTADLTPEFTLFLAERTGHPFAAVNDVSQSLTQSDTPLAKKTVHPPDWLGWSLDLDRQRAGSAQLGDEETGQLADAPASRLFSHGRADIPVCRKKAVHTRQTRMSAPHV